MLRGRDFVAQTVVEGGKIIFNDGGILFNLQHGAEEVQDAAWITAQRSAPDVENYMKQNAPWQDQTGNARNGLAARPFREGDSTGIDLFHQVPYGIWLEVRFSGKYAIIQPTLDAMGPVVMRRYERLLDRI